MVRGRRARVHEATSSTVTLGVNGSQFADDQYCASPKRKDCRIDDKNLSTNYKQQQNLKQNNGTIKVIAVGLGSSSSSSSSSSGGGGSGGGGHHGSGNIGGHQRQIKDMFRTATRSQSQSIKNNNNSSSDIKCSQSMHSKIKNGCIKKIFANGNNLINGKNNNYHHRDDDDDDDDNDNENNKVKNDTEDDTDDDDDDDDCDEILSTEMNPTKNNNENYVNHDIITINIDDDEQIENYDNNDDCNIKITRNKRNMKRSHNQRKQKTNHTAKNSLKTSRKPQKTTATTSSSSNNIFLQEPVLCLNVDKSPNQPSSIKINKTFEVNPIFSLQSNHNNNHNHNNFHHLNLNGQFNKIVTLNTSPKHDNVIIKKLTNDTSYNSKNTVNQIGIISSSSSFSSSSSSSSTEGSTITIDSVSSTTKTTTNTSILLNSDSNSCDSGVVIDKINKNELSPNRRRKPATPHRIVCPSPVKHAIVEKLPSSSSSSTTTTTTTAASTTSTTALASLSSSSSTSSLIMNGSGGGGCGGSHRCAGGGGGGLAGEIIASLMNVHQKRHPKSRRRLNANHYENNSSSMTSPQLVGGIILSTDTLKKINKNEDDDDDDNDDIGYTNILNSAKNPTAEQNTNNNFKSCHQASNQQKRNNGHHNHTQKELSSNQIQENDGNKKLTDYFPVRRSVRKTKKVVQEEIMQNIEKAILEGREDGLKIEYFDDKGRGVVAERSFQRGEFVVEYIGDLITMSEANQREKKYSLDENAGCYMYYFKHKNQQYCIDATAETGKFGRLVNHSRNGNLITKIVVIKNRPHLVLIAKDDIQPGEELTYDYGDRSKESLLHHPWLAL